MIHNFKNRFRRNKLNRIASIRNRIMNSRIAKRIVAELDGGVTEVKDLEDLLNYYDHDTFLNLLDELFNKYYHPEVLANYAIEYDFYKDYYYEGANMYKKFLWETIYDVWNGVAIFAIADMYQQNIVSDIENELGIKFNNVRSARQDIRWYMFELYPQNNSGNLFRNATINDAKEVYKCIESQFKDYLFQYKLEWLDDENNIDNIILRSLNQS